MSDAKPGRLARIELGPNIRSAVTCTGILSRLDREQIILSDRAPPQSP
jgi:hypothetical protein